MKTIITAVILSFVLMMSVNNTSYGQRHDRDGDRDRVRAHISIGTPAVSVHYSNYRPRGYYHGYYHRAGYVYPAHRVYYQRAYPADRYWVPGYWDAYGYWVPGHWEWY